MTGSQEVRGSIPLVSTRALNEAPTQVGAFFHIGTQGQRRHNDPPGRQDRALNGRRVHGSISRRGSMRWMLFCHPNCKCHFIRALGATVSAGALHARGWGFESLIAHHLIEKAPSDGGLSFLGPVQRDSNPPARLSQRPWPENGKNEYCYLAYNMTEDNICLSYATYVHYKD